MSDPEMLEAVAGEVGAVAELARQAAGNPDPVMVLAPDPELGQVEVNAWVLHEDQRLHLEPLERYQGTPARHRGQARTTEPDSFVTYVRRLGSGATTVWVDQASPAAAPTVTAVLNDHSGMSAAWRDHRVVLALRPTPLWAHWTGRDGKLTGQLEFAEHVEDGLAAIVEPSAADMLEIAQTFDANRKVQFRSATRIANSEVQLRWDEDTEAKAGRSGQLEVPDRFTLMLEPWPGSGGAYEVQARLRYRLRDGQLHIGYRLDRIDEVIRRAVADLRNHLTAELPDFPVLAGQAPGPVTPAGLPA